MVRRGGVMVVVALSLGAAGCGSSPLCAPSGCAGVRGVVETCGGPAPGRCSLQRVASVTLLDSRGRVSAEMFPAQGHLLNGRFFFGAQLPGHYTLETRLAGRLWKQPVVIPTDRTTSANIVIPIR